MIPKTLTKTRLLELLIYDNETGVFSWRLSRGCAIAGSEAGTRHNRGYIRIMVDGHLELAHRLAWLYVHGEWPCDEIDHINGVRDDNRICNLRQATNTENMRNRKNRSDNTSGHKGVTWDRQAGRWQVRVGFGGKQHHIGYFDDVELAALVSSEARHKFHAEFARD